MPVFVVAGVFVWPIDGLVDADETRIKFVPLASNKKFSPRTISRRYDDGTVTAAAAAAAAVGVFVKTYGLGTVFSNFRRFDLYKMPLIFKNEFNF